ncbi:bifunctional tRNA (5-methylaminomethyl-2-thiouridine)(34)-methyltransferase MnmD/FAD-dependent 5-carboxymethylaminomethyl-2-thiouridine(34) oxidoreductase MnmC [Caballeronia sp. SBC2]|uniref:bifunctional tRNA (5-methylaminomethyl-2-thiouridine)(34)-methyltransferase MnmD/FAD-dependent 5-carboxymethylaminomethyl-2-thiouridine(34) oxidoreductase MnmC n=1 Tax=Caballeronia sp. SBC2 TaxID=2705547 RepID=UPI0013E1A11A|nr:bifunctional tRNA (5-methylaminomethyl-2-thiouridine)(34)-methyltransferase MnmD/FAD-dependent 5-carboxymethylaminomethyl-2-thiouridine(34) oxidoreductase MnmC [Caballeronia sp. SBC2]QIE25525.1 tRNA 5-methylaminomethyl-2-thiouridine biosynthesis bifunctional protein MnmC [Caballeronia sp. SBC2]
MTHSFFCANVLVDRERWFQRRNFTVLQAEFDAARLFIETWATWRADPQRCERLHFVAVAPLASMAHPDMLTDQPSLSQLVIDAWPMQVAGLHRLEFENGRVVLTLAIGELEIMLQKVWLRADAFYLRLSQVDAKLAYIAKALARVAGDQATLCAQAQPLLPQALRDAGFICDETPDGTHVKARFAPRWRVRRHEPPLALAIENATPSAEFSKSAVPASSRQMPRHAIVIGAGLAGCAITERLASRGWRVSLIERHNDLAHDASGNPAGVFHPIVWRDDSIAARLTRAGFLYALHRWSELERAGHTLNRSHEGLLQIADSTDDAHAIASAIKRFGLPPSYVIAVDEHEATRLAGQPVARPGWFFPHGGWISPAAICAAQCKAAGDLLTPRFGTEVARIDRKNDTWTAFDTTGRAVAHAPVVILANAGDAQRLAGLHGLPTRGVRGQLTLLDSSPLDGLRVPIVGDGYAVPLGAHRTLTGATYDIDDINTQIQAAGHIENLERVAMMLPALAGFVPQAETLEGRVAFRSVTSDRMPMIGALADESAARANATRLSGAWPLDLPRTAGLYGAFAFGSRGLVWSTLAAELIAAQIEGEPWPIERELAEAIDPGRFLLRALRQGELG